MTPRRNITPGPGQPWSRYEPSAEAPWDLRRVVHLHRRAGFAANWAEIRRDLKDGPEASVSRVLAGASRIGGVSEEFESTSTLLADAAVASGDVNRLRAWWAFRMLGSPDPLGERLTLMWHSHFATAQSKVEDLALIRRQNDTLRRLARAPFAELLGASIREPALLLYLDAPTNRKDHPNENLARELMELFTVGIGHYKEADVKEAARALTGRTVEDGASRDVPQKHDDGDKAILGRTGKFDAPGLLALLVDHPGTPRRVARRLCELFLGEGVATEAIVQSLADELTASRLDVGKAVETVLRSSAFFDPGNIGNRVIAPAEFVVGACRALAPTGSTPSTLLLADWIGRLGQELFEPPNVGGWPGGRAWLTGRSLVARANFAAALVEGRPVGLPAPIDPASLAAEQGLPAVEARRAASTLLSGVAPPDRKRSTDSGTPEEARRALATLLASPESQLG